MREKLGPRNNIVLLAATAAFVVFAVGFPALAQQWALPVSLPPVTGVTPFIDPGALNQVKRGNFAVGSSDAAWSGTMLTGTSGAGLSTNGAVFMRNGTAIANWYVSSGVLSLSVNSGSGVVDFSSAKGLLLPNGYIWTDPAVKGSLVYEDAGNEQTFRFYEGSRFRGIGYGDVSWTPDASGNISYKDGNVVLGTGLKIYGDVTAKNFYFLKGAVRVPAVPSGTLCGLTFQRSDGSAYHKWKCADKYPEEGCPVGWESQRFGDDGGGGGLGAWDAEAQVCVKK